MTPILRQMSIPFGRGRTAGLRSPTLSTFIACSAVGLLGACSILDTTAQRGYSEGPTWSTAAIGDAPATTTSTIFTTADVRMVSQRTHPLLKNPVVCTEPAPDVAIALSTAAAATAQGGNGAANGSLGASGSSAEAVAELAGRSTALLGLRDGLYRACEAYANGILGQDAYALVISHYSQLMTTLFLGQDIAAAAPKATATATSPTLQNPAPAPTPTPKPATTTTTTTTPATSASDSAPLGLPQLIPATYQIRVGRDTGETRLLQKVATAPAGDTTTPSTTPAKTTADQSGTSQDPSTPTATPTATNALALTRMNEDYLHLGILGVVVIGCINDGDRTRFRPKDEVNSFLKDLCKDIHLANLEKWDGDTLPPFVDPTAGSKVATAPASDKKKTAAAAGDPTVLAVQKALLKLGCTGCNPGRIDGIIGSDTTDAVRAYQALQKLPVNGDPKDPETLTRLGIALPVAPAPAKKKNA